jgi:4-hydroxybenzoate polyprenyltransferase
LVLVTAADRRIAEALAARTDLFDEVLASDGVLNLKGQAKATALVARFGQGGFDYVGDARVDLPVWQAARQAIVVGGTGLQEAARRVATVSRIFPPEQRRLPTVLRALRLHQWVKNLLIFLPLLAAHQVNDGASLMATGLAFLAFGLTASAVYLLNDLLDLPADRQHPRKCQRPFASGNLPLAWGLLMTPLLLTAAAFLSLIWLPPLFLVVLGGYLAMTTAYSLVLKRVAILDVMMLAALYTVRVIAGATAVAILPSFWLLAFSIFMFLSLALVKRFTELLALKERGALTAVGRGWHIDDLSFAGSLGAASGVASVLVLALYIDSEPAQVLYETPEALWFICPLLLYWISRLWLKTHRGQMDEDPVVFALQDGMSLLIGALAATIALFATFGIGL